MSNYKVFNKLVRDKIVDQITNSGREPEFKTLDQKDFINALKAKLHEEIAEFSNAKNLQEEKEELADIMEVIDSLNKALSSYPGEVSKVQKKKRKDKGGFEKKHFLIQAKIS